MSRVPKGGMKDYGIALIHGDSLVGVLPLHLDQSSMRLISTGCTGSGPVLSALLSEKWRVRVAQEFLNRAEKLALRVGAKSINWEYPVVTNSVLANKGVPPLYDLDLINQTVMHSVIPLRKSEADLWNALSQSARQSIQKALKKGYTVAAEPWTINLDDYYEIHTQTYHRTGVNPHPREYFEELAKLSEDLGTHKLFVSRDSNGLTVAYHNSAVYGETGMYHTGCSTNVAAEDGVNHLLFWSAMNSLKDAGVRHYDSGIVIPRQSSKSKLHGISEFKRKFGGELHPSFRVFQSYDQHPKSGSGPGHENVLKVRRSTISSTLRKFSRKT